jgi:hypothetical protein
MIIYFIFFIIIRLLSEFNRHKLKLDHHNFYDIDKFNLNHYIYIDEFTEGLSFAEYYFFI